MRRSIEQVLETCLAQLNSGRELEEILEGYPLLADELRPMLAAAALARIDIPPPERKEANREVFLAMVAERRRAVNATDGYCNELKAGVPLSRLVEQAPPEVEPLLHAAWTMYSAAPPTPDPTKVAAGRKRLMSLAAERRRQRLGQRSLVGWARDGIAEVAGGLISVPSVNRRVLTGAFATVAACLVMFVGVAGIGTAAASSLPGEPFYGMKRLGENARMLFAFDPVARADLNLRFSERRLDEIRDLVENGREVPLDLVAAWLHGQSDAWAEIQALPAEKQEELAQALLASLAAQAEIEGRLGESVSDPVGLAELLGWARSLADSARSSVAPEPAPESTEVASPVVEPAPLPLPRPLPPSDLSPRPAAEEPEPAPPVVQPGLSIEPEVQDAPEDEAPPMVQPGNPEPARDEREDRDDEEDQEAPEKPTSPPSPDPTPNPPPYVQPPVDIPTPDAGEPDPGAGGSEQPGGDDQP